MAEITKEYAENIAHKLLAKDESKPRSEHDEMVVYHEGRFVARFGIRRGSKRNSGHDHVQKNLNVSTRFAKELATCTKSRMEYFEKIGIVRSESQQPEETAKPTLGRPWEKDWLALQKASEEPSAEGPKADLPEGESGK
jgi:hypothetical protein